MCKFKFIIMTTILCLYTQTFTMAERSVDTSEPVGIVEESEPSWYAIMSVPGEQHRKLYAKGDLIYSEKNPENYLRIEDIKIDKIVLKDLNKNILIDITPGEAIPIEGLDLIYEKSIKSAIIEYRYKASDDASVKDDFVLKRENDAKVILEKKYNTALIKQSLSDEEKKLFEMPETNVQPQETIKAGLFEKIEVEKIGEDTWSIKRDSAKDAFSNAGHALVSVIKSVRPQYRFGEGPSLKFNCELGDVVLGKDGFLVQNLAVAKLAERFGIKQGDLIKRINGQNVNTLYGIFRVYMNIKSNPGISTLVVDIVRDGRPKTLVYKIRY